MPFKDVLKQPTFEEQRPRAARLYPSGASLVDRYGKVQGGCNRSQWFRLMGYKKTEPNDFRGWANMGMGRAVETEVIKQLKAAGRWIANSVKLYDPETNLSGEVDIIAVNDDGMPVMIECKTFSGGNPYARKEIMGAKGTTPKPKLYHVLQLAIYLHIRERAVVRENPYAPYDREEVRDNLLICPYGVLLYVDRNEPNYTSEFRISVRNGSVCYRHESSTEVQLLCHMDDVLSRCSELMDHYHAKTIPPRDYQGQYDDDTLAEMHRLGNMTPRERQIYQDTGFLAKGDFWCRAQKDRTTGGYRGLYCDYWNRCRSVDDGTFVPEADLLAPFEGDDLDADEEIVTEATDDQPVL